MKRLKIKKLLIMFLIIVLSKYNLVCQQVSQDSLIDYLLKKDNNNFFVNADFNYENGKISFLIFEETERNIHIISSVIGSKELIENIIYKKYGYQILNDSSIIIISLNKTSFSSGQLIDSINGFNKNNILNLNDTIKIKSFNGKINAEKISIKNDYLNFNVNYFMPYKIKVRLRPIYDIVPFFSQKCITYILRQHNILVLSPDYISHRKNIHHFWFADIYSKKKFSNSIYKEIYLCECILKLTNH